MTFWSGSGSADPTPDPPPFFSGFNKDAKKMFHSFFLDPDLGIRIPYLCEQPGLNHSIKKIVKK